MVRTYVRLSTNGYMKVTVNYVDTLENSLTEISHMRLAEKPKEDYKDEL